MRPPRRVGRREPDQGCLQPAPSPCQPSRTTRLDLAQWENSVWVVRCAGGGICVCPCSLRVGGGQGQRCLFLSLISFLKQTPNPGYLLLPQNRTFEGAIPVVWMRLISFLLVFHPEPSLPSPRFTHLSLFLRLNMHFYKCHFPDPLSTAFCKTQLRHTSVHTGPSSCQPRVLPPNTHTHITASRFSHRVRAHYLTGTLFVDGRCVLKCVCT